MENKKMHQTFCFHIYPRGWGWTDAFLGQTGWQSAILQSSPDCKLDVKPDNCLKVVAKYVLLLKCRGLFFLPPHIATASYPNHSLGPVAFSTSAFILSLKVADSFFPCLFPSKITFSTPKETSPHFSLFNHFRLKISILPCDSISHSTLLQPNIPNFHPSSASSASQAFPCVSGTVTLLLPLSLLLSRWPLYRNGVMDRGSGELPVSPVSCWVNFSHLNISASLWILNTDSNLTT